MLGTVLRAAVGHNVDCASPVSCAVLLHQGVGVLLTEHVTLAVLAATLVGNVGLDAKVHERKVFDRETNGLDATDQAEAAAVVEIMADFVELWPNRGKGEVVSRDTLAAEFEACIGVSQSWFPVGVSRWRLGGYNKPLK